jgi:hypothetical protein
MEVNARWLNLDWRGDYVHLRDSGSSERAVGDKGK